MRIINTRDCNFGDVLERIVNRASADVEEIERRVKGIIADVKQKGDAALLECTRKFDKVVISRHEVCVTKEEKEQAIEEVGSDIYNTLKKAASRIKKFHLQQLQRSYISFEDGIVLGQVYRPIEKAGIYVPGGKAPYPSSVLMNAIPAKIAGVDKVYMVSPPGVNGRLNPYLIAAAEICGVDAIFKVGGAQAIAALAYGTDTIPKVDKIVGPGNIYVATAKKMVFGDVDIDMIAGPSEIVVVSDGKIDASWVAADLLSQAEHDEMASAILLTDNSAFAKEVCTEIDLQLNQLSRKSIAASSIDSFGVIVVCDTLDEAIDIANTIAPEHLEVCVENPWQYMSRLKNAGAIFLGNYTPEALGDYVAGPNHVLPTGGTAKFSSPLGVEDFQKRTSLLYFSESGFASFADDVEKLAEIEGLTAHKHSVAIRRSI